VLLEVATAVSAEAKMQQDADRRNTDARALEPKLKNGSGTPVSGWCE
jgi:hypothetical protein